jgi:hypothetical protein
MSEIPPTPPEAKPRRKPGPPKGFRRGVKSGGRVKGTPNRVTLEARERARVDQERIAELERQAAGAKDEITRTQLAGKKLMKDIAFDFAAVFAGLAAFYQPVAPLRYDPIQKRVISANPNYDEAKFNQYATLAKDTAIAAAKYQSPSYSAVMVGASVVTKVEISGGLPDDYAPPVPAGQVIDLKPGMEGVISAEDEAPPELPKAVNE